MKTTTLLLAFLFICLGFICCDKSNTEEPVPSIPKIKSITHGTQPNADKEYYVYDQLGRVTSITFTGHEVHTTQYIYLKDRIICKSEFFPGTDTLYLNDQGMIISEMGGSFTYAYDQNGYCIKFTGCGSDGKTDLEYQYKVAQGNTIGLDVWEAVNEKLVYKINWDYVFLNNSVNTIGNENKGITFYGKQDKNLLSISTQNDIGFSSPDRENYFYDIDAKNRVVKRWRQRDPGNYDLYTYYE